MIPELVIMQNVGSGPRETGLTIYGWSTNLNCGVKSEALRG
jgi:hypothetical protein